MPLSLNPCQKKCCRFSLVECKNRREEGGNVMLCKQILYLKENKKSTKTAVKYLHLWRFRQNIKSSCTVKSPVLFLSILSFSFFFASFCMSSSDAHLCTESCSYKDELSTKRQRWSWRLAGWAPKDHPCGKGYTSHSEPSVKSTHVPKNRTKIWGILGIFFPYSCVF